MRREFLLNVFFLIGINVLIKPFYLFGIERTVQNVVGKETYGIYFTLLSLTYLLQALADLGVGNYNNRNIARHNQLLDKYFPYLLGLKLALGAFFLVVLFGVAAALGYTSALEWRLLIFLGINQVLISLILYLRTNISGLGGFRTDSRLSAMDKGLMVLIGSVLLFVPYFRARFRIEWLVYAQTASLVLTAATAFWLNGRRLSRIRVRFQRSVWWVILRKSLPFALVLLLTSIYTRVDALMLSQLLPDGDAQVGIYGAAYRLLDAGNMLGFLFAGLLLPMFARMLKEKQRVLPMVQLSASLIWVISLTAAALLTVFRQPVMELLYDEATPYWGELLGTLIWTFPAVCGTYVYGTLLTANGRLAPMNWLFLISIFINVALNAYLIPRQAAIGAALATDLTQWGVLIGQMLLARRMLGLHAPLGWLLRMILFLVLVLGGTYACALLPVHWIVAFLLAGGAAVVWAFVLGIAEVRGIRLLLGRERV